MINGRKEKIMKKILALLLVCVIAFAIVSCNEEPTPPSEFSVFEEAIDQTPASKINVNTKITTEVEILHSTIETVLNPNGSATINFYIERLNSDDFTTSETVVSKTGTVTLNKDGTYSDGGEFKNTLGANIATVKLGLDSSKLENYTVESGVLSATVKAENTAAVLGTAIGYDVNFMLTVSDGNVVSIVIKYTSDFGPVEAVISYN